MTPSIRRRRHEPTLEELWETAPPGEEDFRAERVATFPEPARRYLEHAIAEGTRVASAVRLRMHGEIRLKGWLPFRAEQVICRDRGMIWRATVRMFGLPIRGSDRFVDGGGALRWKLLGLVPVMSASGPDIDRSAADRVRAESVWLPSTLLGPEVEWSAPDAARARARLAIGGHEGEVELVIDGDGRLEAVRAERWGDPDGRGWRLAGFGGVAEREATFGGYTIPTRLRIGWHFGTERFHEDGEFFRATIDEAEYR